MLRGANLPTPSGGRDFSREVWLSSACVLLLLRVTAVSWGGMRTGKFKLSARDAVAASARAGHEGPQWEDPW